MLNRSRNDSPSTNLPPLSWKAARWIGNLIIAASLIVLAVLATLVSVGLYTVGSWSLF